MSADPAMADGLNWYRYANNNPIMYSDPSGMNSVGNTSVDPGFSVEFKPFEIRIKIGKSGGSSSGGDSATAPADNGDNNSSADNNEGTGDSNTGGNQSGEESNQNQDGTSSSNEQSSSQPLTPNDPHTSFGHEGDSRILLQTNTAIDAALKASGTTIVYNYRKDKAGNYILDENGNKVLANDKGQIHNWGCLFMSILAIAQITTGDELEAERIVELFRIALAEGHVADTTFVKSRERLLEMVFREMGYEVEVVDGRFAGPIDDAITFNILSGNGHFELADANGNIIYRSSNYRVGDNPTITPIYIRIIGRREE